MNNRNRPGYFEDDGDSQVIRVVTGVYVWMLIGLMVSALTAIATLTVPALSAIVYGSGIGYLFLIIATLVLVWAVFPRIYDMSAGAAYGTFLLYAVINGMTLSSIFIVYDLGQIGLAFISAAAMFGIMAVYGIVTKADLSGKGNMLMMGLVGIIVATLLNFIFRSTFLDTIISYVAIAIFLGLTAYDTQRIKAMAYNVSDERSVRTMMILGALNLYLDFINLFLRVLRLLSRRNR